MEQSECIHLSRLTVATATDFLREYHTELLEANSEGEYTDEMSKTIEILDNALE